MVRLRYILIALAIPASLAHAGVRPSKRTPAAKITRKQSPAALKPDGRRSGAALIAFYQNRLTVPVPEVKLVIPPRARLRVR